MKKHYTNSTNKILISFILKAFVTTIISVLFFSFIASELIFKLDLDLNNTNIISIIIVTLSSFLISHISVHGIKNNGALFGLISQIPLAFYMIINVIFNNSNVLILLVKLALLVLVGSLVGIFTANKSKKIKVR